MDFNLYLKEVEKQLGLMTESQKDDWIYEQARTVSKDKRIDLLNSLSGKMEIHTDLSADAILEWCEQVESGSIYLESEYYEYYEEDDWESDWRIEYHDKFGAMTYLAKAIKVCEQLLAQKKYGTVYRLLERICGLEFRVDCDEEYGFDEEDEGISLERLVEEGLLSLNLRALSLCLLYACYQAHEGEDRIKKMYGYLCRKMCKSVLVTDVFAYGPEKITDADSFMEEWHTYLQKIQGNRAVELLVDACIYIGDDDYLLETAEKNRELHPYLYEACCERKYQAGDYASCMKIAAEAIRRINRNKVIRAEISDIAVRAGKQSGKEADVEPFYRAAFDSKPDSRHLLRLYQLKNREVLAEALRRVEELPIVSSWRKVEEGELSETGIGSKEQKEIYQYLLGDFETVLQCCMSSKKYLGWSSELKGIIIPLFLLYLKKDEAKKTMAERKLIENVKFRLGYENVDYESFEEQFAVWRRLYTMPKEREQYYIEWLTKEIDKRTEQVVGGGYRNSYHKAAELIVVLGAVREERGEAGAMRKLVDFYKQQHSRKRAFRSEIDTLKEAFYRGKFLSYAHN